MMFTLVVFLGLLLIACVTAVAIIPRFDRRAPLTQPRAEVAKEARASPFRSAR